MGKIAFVFSGQGDQFPGMGKDLYDKYPAARAVFDMCDAIRPGTSAQCFEGTDEELKETKNTQPCLFAMELAAASVLLNRGLRPAPASAAGFSLGEVVAAAFSGLFNYETGFRLVCKRGELMQKEAETCDTSMAAVVKLSAETVEALCRHYSDVYPVNFNCPGQIAVSGLTSQMTDFMADVKANGGRAIPLKVKGAFHSPFMNAAAEAFAAELSVVFTEKTLNSQAAEPVTSEESVTPEEPVTSFSENPVTLYSNMTALPYGDDVVSLLSKQICHPVKWEALIRRMIDDGIDTFIEIGPGKTLTNMIRKISADVKAVTYAEYLAEEKIC